MTRGIQARIVDGESGVLIDDPRDLCAFADALAPLIADPARCHRLGEAGRQRARDHFLGIRHLLDYAEIIPGLLG